MANLVLPKSENHRRAKVHESINIMCWPGVSKDNPYQSLFYSAITKFGFDFRGQFQLNNQWLADNLMSAHVLHFHWPEQAWRWRGDSKSAVARGLVGLRSFLRRTRRTIFHSPVRQTGESTLRWLVIADRPRCPSRAVRTPCCPGRGVN